MVQEQSRYKRFDFIKLDIEGEEKQLLRDRASIDVLCEARCIFMEVRACDHACPQSRYARRVALRTTARVFVHLVASSCLTLAACVKLLVPQMLLEPAFLHSLPACTAAQKDVRFSSHSAMACSCTTASSPAAAKHSNRSWQMVAPPATALVT